MTLSILQGCENDSQNQCVLKKVSPYCIMCSEKQDNNMENLKSRAVPLEEALDTAGVGLYTYYVMLVSGFVVFIATVGIQVMSIIIPAAGCDLALSSVEKGALTSMSFSGMIFSSFLFGFLADTYGRRNVMIWSGILNTLMSTLSSFAPNDVTLMVIWFFNGFLLGGVLTPAFVYVSEFCPQRIRARSILVPYGLSSLASVYLPCIAWLVLPLKIHVPLFWGVVFTPWRLYLLVVTAPAILLSILLLYYLPESPKFTLNQGKGDETLQVLRSMYARNLSKSRSDFPIDMIYIDASDEMTKEKEITVQQNSLERFLYNLVKQLVILFRPPLLLYTTVSCVILFGVIGSYNTIYLWYPEQLRMVMRYKEDNSNYNASLCDITSQFTNRRSKTGCEINHDLLIISIVTALVQSAVCALVSVTADKAGRRNLIVLFCGISGGLCILLVYVHSYLLTVGALSLSVIFLSTTFPIGLSLVVDFFPTSLRSTATSITMLFGRMGAAGGSQIFGALFQAHCEFAYWGMLVVLIGTVILIIMMPSKRNQTT